MTMKHTFPAPECNSCPHYQTVGGLTRYCNGFKRRKPKQFKKSDPKVKIPNWCPRKITPPTCRVYGFKDEKSEFIELLRRMEYEQGKIEAIYPSEIHYQFRQELHPNMTARQIYDATQQKSLCEIISEKIGMGEIVEIDDGLRPYFFYIVDSWSVIPLSYFRLLKDM